MNKIKTKIKITPEIIEQRTEKVRDFLKGLYDLRPGQGVRACGMNKGLNKVSTVRSAGCHAQLNAVPSPIILGGGFFPKESEMRIAEKFWAWVTDKDNSPWKKLMQNGIELVYSDIDKLPVGWILPYETISKTPFQFQKNFCVLTRVFTEKHQNFIVWDELVSTGMKETDAFYLASSLRKEKKGYSVCNSQNLGGAHWPITDWEYIDTYSKRTTSKRLDFKAFRSGEIIDNDSLPDAKGWSSSFSRELINGYFQEIVPSKRTIFDIRKNCEIVTQKGKFSSQSHYELDNIIDSFYKWQNQEGLL